MKTATYDSNAKFNFSACSAKRFNKRSIIEISVFITRSITLQPKLSVLFQTRASYTFSLLLIPNKAIHPRRPTCLSFTHWFLFCFSIHIFIPFFEFRRKKFIQISYYLISIDQNMFVY
jgi:hypothetical protein